MRRLRRVGVWSLLALTGCTTSHVALHAPDRPDPHAVAKAALSAKPSPKSMTTQRSSPADDDHGSVRLASLEDDDDPLEAANASPAVEVAPPLPPGPANPIALEQVVTAIYQSYPLLRLALLDRDIAAGENVTAQGEWDFKIYADSNNTPEGFYKTYRQAVGFEQPLYGGGSLFGRYRIGRGSFEPWYLERQTNDGGEFRLGLSVPLWQNRTIDERRAQLWRTAYGRDLVEPEIRTQLLVFIRDGSIAYWEWVGSGRQLIYAEQLLKLAQDRDAQLRRQVEQGDRPEADLTDNERLIVSRRVKRLDALRKFQSNSAKLSLYLRMPDGSPFVPAMELLPAGFPEPSPIQRDALGSDIAFAQSRRPEILALDVQRQILNVDLCQAQNLTQPELDGYIANSQDVGAPTSIKRDKSRNETEAGVYFSVPLQRRKAFGKITAVEAKIAQLNAKRQFASDKISVEVQAAVIALDTAYQAIDQARQAVRLNEEMERFELIRLDKGDSDFLRLNLREQATFDARTAEIDALLRYFEALSEYRAAVAADLPEVIELAE